ncbi:recombinase family protein [Methylophilus sp.]|uniref:recombinase family protein n=1 Tax=Methylophilus sp. TaxID=29541 RepID=UPI0011D64FF9|nr:recombinase family protein [Methylophilus sp.]TXI44188.1 MAG: recombinase family protein [Methylophilus sp.]
MKVAIYARVSTTRQAENDLSIPDQLRQMRDWAKANGHITVLEFVEPGASATDDKRPEFQSMIAAALVKPNPFDAIVIHSLSRFFRDGIEFGVYERKLAKNKVKVISITQPTSDDAGGEMMRRIITLFDEHQSRETSKHTSRAMRENARQGYFNGSKPPYGYMVSATDVQGSRGRKKKKLSINEAEADVVKKIYQLYLKGNHGKSMGVKEIAIHLNSAGLNMRGKLFGMQKVHKILSDTLYMGEYYFNVINSKTREKRPPSEWVKTEIPQVINPHEFEQVRLKRESRAPKNSNPRAVSSPCLMTGLLKCGGCGNALTLATGKGGKYRYYKCTRRRNKGNDMCDSKNLPMEKLDQLILNQLADKAFSVERMQELMSSFRRSQQAKIENTDQQNNMVQRQLDQLDERQHRLLDAIESGVVELDELTQKRMQQIKISREALLIEQANLKHKPAISFEPLRASQIEKMSNLLRAKLLGDDQEIARNYLHLLVSEVKVTNGEIVVKGGLSNLIVANEIATIKNGHIKQVPTSIPDWCARRDSNSRPLASESTN